MEQIKCPICGKELERPNPTLDLYECPTSGYKATRVQLSDKVYIRGLVNVKRSSKWK